MPAIDLTYSAEMMENNLQAELISPLKKFEALQTRDGFSLLFTIGTNGALNLIRDQNGTSAGGWSVTDLSQAQIAKDFPSGNATVSTFEAGQSAVDGSLGMAMVVESDGASNLYLSLGNSNQDLSWTEAPRWTAYPYDNPSIRLSKLEIVDVYFCEPAGNVQYIVVDVVRDPSSAVKDVRRFFIDPTKQSGHYWNSHNLPIDIEVDAYASVLGRAPKGLVDGLYTSGRAGSSGQLAFVPILNVFGTAPPTPVRLELPGGAVPSAIASVRNDDLSTDLFAVSGSSLYYFASSNQADGATGVLLITNDVLSGTDHLAAMEYRGVVTLWGRNGNDEVYSLACPTGSLGNAGTWSVPVPLLSGMERMSPYVNVADGGNTIFASGGGKLERVARDAVTKLWVRDQITLPAPPKQKSISFNSYTTTIQVTDDEGLPQRDVMLSLSASQRSALYINGLYYVVGDSPVHINTTSVGTVTIVEATGTLSSTTFTVSAGGGTAVTINPMDEPFEKLAALDTPEALKSAKITGSDGGTRYLVSRDASDDDLKTVASGLKKLGNSYDHLSSNPAPRAKAAALVVPAPVVADSLGEDIAVAVGDLFMWLESGVEAVIEVVEDAAAGAWHFVAKIGEETYRAVLDTVHAVVGAVQWVFKAVETAVEDLIKFVEFLFDWDDIRRTKDVLHNVIKRFLEGQVASIRALEQGIDDAFQGLEKTVATWAGITDWSGLGPPASKPATQSTSNPMKGQTSGSQHLWHHFQNNASDITVTGGAPTPSLLQSLIDDLFTALKNEADVLDAVIDQLEELAKDFASLSIEDVLKRLVGILIEGVLGSAVVVINVILDILAAVADQALRMLDAKIHIPVISDILNGIGIPDLSFLDLFSWIAAVAYTVVYKIAEGEAPFPNDANTTFLSTATSIQQLQRAFDASAAQATATPPLLAAHLRVAQPAAGSAAPTTLLTARAAASPTVVGAPTVVGGPIAMPDSVAQAVFVAGHVSSGFFTLMSDFVSTFEAASPSGDNPWSIPSAILGALSGGTVGVTDFLVPRDPIKNSVVSAVSTGTTVIRLLNKAVFSSVLQERFAAAEGIMSNLAANDGRATGAVIDAILVVPALACTAYHFVELAEDAAGGERTAAILGEVANLTSYISRVSYAVAVNDDDEESRAIIIGVMAVANVAYAGLQTAEAIAGASSIGSSN